ncbi:SHD1 domain-containing protein [Anatilimnocola floriformis]|uniref:SHD1 domain-containing protein n=1 Tax=Anatilimnocola floriformis TaxID=2948575 RepID=UPI0020C32813|nr:SHD1 domain-containing protein [Anatilimnocola floriformis]
MRWAFCLLAIIVSGWNSVALAREWSDATGSFKIEAELVAVRGGKVVLEKADGAIISVPLEKLSAADQKYLADLKNPAPSPAPAIPTPMPPGVGPQPVAPTPVTAQGKELAEKAHAVLKSTCYRCHGEDGASEGGFNFALNLAKVAKTLVNGKNASASVLYQRLTTTDDSVMPPVGESPRPSPQDIAVIKAWIEAGSPAISTEKPREFVTNESVVKLIAADAQAYSERSRRFLRYFTLTHLYNAGVSEDELQTYRNAFSKLINSLSWNTSLLVPHALDPARTVYRIDMRELHWNVAMWERIQQANPYFLNLQTPDAKLACELTQCEMPYVRIDWFVFAASKPPLYHVLLGLPETDAELENLLRVNVQANIDQEQAIRAAFNRSGVSQNNRLIEWHKSPYGSYWKSYDFGRNTGRQNLFEYPLGPGTTEGMFKHDGGELIFTLPNGLQGYLLVDENGKRIDQGPTAIVSDPKRPDKAVTNGVSCMSCHYTGVIPKVDEVGPAVRANAKAYENSKDILALYREPADLNRVLTEDAKRFAGAMQKLGVSSLSRSGEPISAMAARFELELDPQLAAAEFGLKQDDFFKRLDESPLMSRRFAALRTPGGVLKRDVFAVGFGEATVELKITIEARVNIGGSPSVAATSPSPARPITPSTPGRPGDKPAEVARFNDLTWGVKSLAFHPNGTMLVAGKPDREIRVFDVFNQAQSSTLGKLDLLSSVEQVIFTPNGSRLLAGGQRGHISIFSASKEGQLADVGQFAGHSKEITCITVSPDGKLALSDSTEKKARLWDVEKGQEIGLISGFEGKIKAVHISKSGRVGMATDGAKWIEFDLAPNMKVKREREFTRSWASGQAAAFSPDGQTAAVGDSYKIRLFNLATGKELDVLESDEIQWTMQFMPDGIRLLSGGSDKVNIWNVKQQKRVHVQAIPNSGYIQSLATSPDNKHAAAAGRSALHVFRLP